VSIRKSYVLLVLAGAVMLAGFFRPGEAQGRVRDGTLRVYLYKTGTGSSTTGQTDIQATVGDTISVDVFIKNQYQEEITGLEFYLTVPDEYFDIVPQGKNEDGSWRPFIKGTFMKTALSTIIYPRGNFTHGDTLTAWDNLIKGWQLDYGEISGHNTGTGRPFSNTPFGVACTFQLVAKAACRDVEITLDRDNFNARVSWYYKRDTVDTFRYISFTSCKISVTGFQIDPPLPNLYLKPGDVDTSIDLDDHVNISSANDSTFTWSTAGNNNITVDIDPASHVVTVSAPSDFRGYEDIVFTSVMKTGAKDTDIMRVTVDAVPTLTEAFPDTVYIHEDSLEVAFGLRDIVADEDDPFESLHFYFKTGDNITHTTKNDSLFIKGKQDYYGIESLSVAVYDNLAAGDSLTVPVFVVPVNDAPTLRGLPDIEFERNETFDMEVLQYAKDVDGDRLTVSWKEPEHLLLENVQSMVQIRGFPSFIGIEDLVFTVTDQSGLAASDTLTVTVTPATNPPVWQKLPKVGFPQSRADSSLVLWDYIADPDDPDSLLTFLVSPTEYQVDRSAVNYQNGRLYLYDLDNRPGWDRLSVTAYDPDGNSATTSFLAFIGPLDGTPIVGGIPDTTMVAGTYTQWIDLDDYYYDVDHADVQMNWTWGRMASPDSSATISINPLTHVVKLSSISPDLYGVDKIFLTVTDPDGKFADDLCNITVLADLSKPSLDLPAKVGFIAGSRDSLDLDTYVRDSMYEKTELGWTWSGNRNATVSLGTPTETWTRPVTFSGPESWIGWERVGFTVINPLGGSAQDTLVVFSVPDDGSPVAGGLVSMALTAGDCIDVNLDDYFYDADTPDYAMVWSVAGNDSISVTIDPVTHVAHVCSYSETWQGTEALDFTVSDPDGHTGVMRVTVSVTGAKLRNILTAKIFRNPMQEDYMDFFIRSKTDLKLVPTMTVYAGDDTTRVTLKTISKNYYFGTYLLPLEISLGVEGTANVIMRGIAGDGKAVEDTTQFAYGRFGISGGKLALGPFSVGLPGGAVREPVLLTVIRDDTEPAGAARTVSGEIEFAAGAFSVGPPSFTPAKPFDVAFTVDALRGSQLRSVSADKGACVFRREGGEWRYLGSGRAGKTVRAAAPESGTYRLGFDRVAPRLEIAGTDENGIEITVSESGSGIDPYSIEVTSGDRPVRYRLDEPGSRILIDGGDVPFDTRLPIVVTVGDRAGNERTERFSADMTMIPGLLLVGQNAPNPFNPATTITFTVTSDSRVTVTVFDLLGRKVRELADGYFTAGSHSLVWSARDDGGRMVSSGVYIYRVSTGTKSVARKMLFIQ